MKLKNWMVYAFGIILFVVIIVVLLFVFARRDNGQDQAKKTPAQTQSKSKIEQAKEAGSSVELVTRGEVVDEDRHRGIRITISASERTVEILSGYDETVIQTQTYSNTQAAYEAFLQALDGAGFTKSKAQREDLAENAACPLGLHYDYIVRTPSENESRLWATNCSRKDGTFDGDGKVVRTLFHNQIPDYRKVVDDVRLTY